MSEGIDTEMPQLPFTALSDSKVILILTELLPTLIPHRMFIFTGHLLKDVP